MLSMKAKYALRSLMVLARAGKKMLPSKTIAKDADVPQKFLEAILLELKNHGFVDSKRGIFGGYFLAEPANKIAISNVIRAIDGPLAPVHCASVTHYKRCEDCVNEATCSVRKVMIKVRDAMADVLDKTTLDQMT